MELNDLNIFRAVAAHGSISKAAAELNYVQSNVTARIKLLEKELDTELFLRHKRGMILNSEGKRFLEYSGEILAKVKEMKRAFQDKSNPSGILDIGIVETVISLPEILSAYYNKYPNVELSLKSGVTEYLLNEVIEMRLDGAFVTGPIMHPLIEGIEVIQEKLVLVSKTNDFNVRDLSTKPLLLYNKGCGYRERLESFMKAEGIIPKQIMEFGTFGTIIGSVSAGLGLSIIPESAVVDWIANGTLYAYDIPKPYREISTIFIRKKESYLTSTLQCFMDEIIARNVTTRV
ncbi:LysR family transcriptional regulator [Paenibacillus sp. L3-i20]|uniref:LysR family transcriptional regulator n=1 Tax=Paenibacillus sp. L3-i20 TaxID=2905833 RepID=UPI001EDF8630|nr:LysR family transcriptional regulator [Paenibacillus sp. L3-i20]GKU77449.1 HTH-type transcriptional regulator CzcR [Paenibacillus sp. L3-i20]